MDTVAAYGWGRGKGEKWGTTRKRGELLKNGLKKN